MSEVIQLYKVSKSYKLGETHGSLRDAVDTWIKRLTPSQQNHSSRREEIWALEDVTFCVEKGEIVGLIGANGAGKTTALKLLTGVTKPTSGKIMVEGRIGSLIELGAGFHPDLTGRENIYLNGTILGLRKDEIELRFDSIVEFSGLSAFIDTPVKRYSSGMYVRLGFSVAAHINPEVLLVDEVLAVGDNEFRVRCMERFQELRALGVTTLIVSHNRHLIESLCSRALYLHKGKVVYDGDPVVAWNTYLSRPAAERRGLMDEGLVDGINSALTITDVGMVDQNGAPKNFFVPGESLSIFITFIAHRHVEDPVFYARIYRDGHLLHGTNTARHKIQMTLEPGDAGIVRLFYHGLNFLQGAYELSLGVEKSFHSRAAYDRASSLHFKVGSGLREGAGMTYLDHKWCIEVDKQSSMAHSGEVSA